MPHDTLFQQVLDYRNRPNPYPLYAQMRETPVSRQADGTYIVSTYNEINALLYDPRISVDERKRVLPPTTPARPMPPDEPLTPPFLVLDPPEHDRLREETNQYFGPPHTPDLVEGLRRRVMQIVTERLDAQRHARQIDIVDALAYPLPVTVICELLGVPREDEPRFRVWSDTLTSTLDPGLITDPVEQQRIIDAAVQIRQYMTELVARRRDEPGDDMLSGMARANAAGRGMDMRDIVSTAILLLIAGHETTVNLVSNGMLILLRNPEALERLRQDPGLVVSAVEEILRYDPPVQFRMRVPLVDIEIGGMVIPANAPLVLMLAAGNRDPQRFANPDTFDPARPDNQHFGFGGSIHYCFGAPLARLEAQVALGELVRRLDNPRLVSNAPPYRENAALRGPRHLAVAFDRVRD